MTILATNWAEAWAITGYGIGTVFVILCLLVLVLLAFNRIMGKAEAPKKTDAIQAAKRQTGEATTISEAMGHDEVAIATALYMYFNDLHDNESGVLTIHHNDNTGWHFQLGN